MSTPKKKKRNRAHPLYYILYPVMSPLVKLFCNVRVKGKENIPKEGGCVVCANHLSNSDVLIIGAVFPLSRQINTMAKSELFSMFLFRWIIKGLGGIPVKRNQTNVDSVKQCINLAKDGRVVLIFPQGRRCFGENPGETSLHSGGAMIAVRSQCPILPVTIQTEGMRFRPFKRTNVVISKPFTYEEISAQGEVQKDYKAITERVFERICDAGGFSVQKEIKNANDSNCQ